MMLLDRSPAFYVSLLLFLTTPTSWAFVVRNGEVIPHPPSTRPVNNIHLDSLIQQKHAFELQRSRAYTPSSSSSSSALSMYSLPPSGGGGGGGGKDDGLKDILTSAATLLGIVAFFVSPLGGILLALLNSFFLLTIFTPVVLIVSFQVWAYFSTLDGPCPKCGAPIRVVKDDDSPSVCINCGTFVQITPDKKGIDFYYQNEGQAVVDEGYEATFWDSLFGGGTGSVKPDPTPAERQSQFRREATIIDVEVDDQK